MYLWLGREGIVLYMQNRREHAFFLSIRGIEGDSPFYSCSWFVYNFYSLLLRKFPHGVLALASRTTLHGEVGMYASGRQVLSAQ